MCIKTPARLVHFMSSFILIRVGLSEAMILLRLIFGLLATVQVFGIVLKCNLKTEDSIQGCNTTSKFEKHENITQVSWDNGADPQIQTIQFFEILAGTQSTHVPSDVCTVLLKLLNIKITGTDIIEIGPKAFRGCKEVVKINFVSTSIYWLPEDLLIDVPNLKEFTIIHSKLKMLPMELLAKNPKIETFFANNNEIEQVDTRFNEKMLSVNLKENTCISITASGSGDIKELSSKLADNCTSSRQKSMQKVIDGLEKNLRNTQNELKSWKGESSCWEQSFRARHEFSSSEV